MFRVGMPTYSSGKLTQLKYKYVFSKANYNTLIYTLSLTKWKVENIELDEALTIMYKELFPAISLFVRIVPDKALQCCPLWFNSHLYMIRNKKTKLFKSTNLVDQYLTSCLILGQEVNLIL